MTTMKDMVEAMISGNEELAGKLLNQYITNKTFAYNNPELITLREVERNVGDDLLGNSLTKRIKYLQGLFD